jgi:hypothetical protein
MIGIEIAIVRKVEETMLHSILWAAIGFLVLLWLLGLVFRLGRCLIHVLLIVAVILLVLNVLGRL